MINTYAVCADFEGDELIIGEPFSENDLPFMKERIKVPVVTAYKVFKPEEMRIIKIEESYE